MAPSSRAVVHILSHSDDRLLVDAMIRIAKGKRIKTIAEHVATPQTRQLLAEYGADYGQGYLFGEPAQWRLSQPQPLRSGTTRALRRLGVKPSSGLFLSAPRRSHPQRAGGWLEHVRPRST